MQCDIGEYFLIQCRTTSNYANNFQVGFNIFLGYKLHLIYISVCTEKENLVKVNCEEKSNKEVQCA